MATQTDTQCNAIVWDREGFAHRCKNGGFGKVEYVNSESESLTYWFCGSHRSKTLKSFKALDLDGQLIVKRICG